MRHALTIDTEDWSALLCSYLGHDTPVSDQFEPSILGCLDLLDEYETRATFFVMASHAAERPEPIREIVRRGHEVASHGCQHAKMKAFSPKGFREDIRRSVETLEELTGQKIRGHRCPFFGLMPEQCWAFEVLLDAGLDYDSSLTTLLWQQDGVELPDQPFECVLPSGRTMIEVPALARKVGPITGRLIGGRTLRVLPKSITRLHMQQREAEELPAMLYVHTYEVTPDGLMKYVPSGIGLRSRMKLFVSAKAFELGMGRMCRALRDMLARYRWGTMADIVDELTVRQELPRVEITCRGQVEVDVETDHARAEDQAPASEAVEGDRDD